MSTTQTYRLACRRSHRLLGTYLAMTAWVRKIDCVVLSRSELLPFLGLERMKNKRVDWLKTDIRGLFPYAENLVDAKTKVYATLYLSRMSFPDGCFNGEMSNQRRVRVLEQMGLKSEVIEIPKEREMVALLAGTIHGLKPFAPATRPVANA